MLMHGIPEFRLEKDVIEAEIDVLRALGVEFHCGVEVGRDVTIPELREQGYKGFYVAIGLQSGGKLGVPGEDAEGVKAGIELMREVNLEGKKSLSGRVVVIGGGNIGADVARTALRCGAEKVSLYCLEDYDSMPMGVEDRTECEEDGIEIHAGWGQTEILAETASAAVSASASAFPSAMPRAALPRPLMIIRPRKSPVIWCCTASGRRWTGRAC